jgi:hypothetical protein
MLAACKGTGTKEASVAVTAMPWHLAALARHLCTRLALRLCAMATAAIDAPGRSHSARICAFRLAPWRRRRTVVEVGSVMRCPLNIGRHDDPYMPRMSQGEFARCLRLSSLLTLTSKMLTMQITTLRGVAQIWQLTGNPRDVECCLGSRRFYKTILRRHAPTCNARSSNLRGFQKRFVRKI